jgi:hypothetical protein
MLRRWARLFVFGATFATLWLVAFPAMASGPLCDDRGATAVAPSPTLIPIEQSLIAGDADDCDRDAQQVSIQRHRAPGERIVITGGDAALPTSPIHVFAAPGRGPRWFVDRDAPRAGVRARVDRPPRI